MREITADDFTSPETMRDVAGFYRTLLAKQERLFRLPDYYGMGPVWVALHHDDVVRILKDPRFLKDVRKAKQLRPDEATAADGPSSNQWVEWIMTMSNMNTVDPPDHTRLRRLVSKAFTPRIIENLRPRIRHITDDLLDAVEGQGQMDVVTDLAFPLPIAVISEMLGIPPLGQQQFRTWTDGLMQATMDPTQGTVLRETLQDFIHYIQQRLATKRAQPADDVMSALVHAHYEADTLTERELLSTIWLLIVGGRTL